MARAAGVWHGSVLCTAPAAERRWLTLEAIAGTAIGIALLIWNDIFAQALL